MNIKYRYYIIRTQNNKKEIYGVVKETKKTITAIVIRSDNNINLKGKTINILKDSISNNLTQFDFTTSIKQ